MSTFSDDCSKTPEHAGIDPKVADILLEKLSTDDDFRATFQADPVLALASLGVAQASAMVGQTPQPGDNFYCMTTNTLASKEEIAAARAQLQQHLAAAGNHSVVFCFEADKIRSTLERS
ncbi:MAG: NHLP-related RiPP peptide [Stenotrophomonas sp.]|uniref:NHLP-related RiPP peptide n=1 Tax=Stenotrophomonas sp. TaxID=69392 RepID=UPI003D6CA68F